MFKEDLKAETIIVVTPSTTDDIEVISSEHKDDFKDNHYFNLM